MAVEQKYDLGDGMRGCEAADYSCKASTCQSQEFGGGGGGGGVQSPRSAALGFGIDVSTFNKVI